MEQILKGVKRSRERTSRDRLHWNLGRVLLLIVGETWRVILLLAVLVAGMVGILALSDDLTLKRLELSDTASIAVFEQMTRARAIGPVDILFVGDSACLMGIDFQMLSARLSRRVELMCAIGYLGPAGYGRLIKAFLENGGSFRHLVLAMHPDLMIRDPSWDFWIQFVDNDGPLLQAPFSRALFHAFHFVEAKVLRPFVRLPMKGAFGLFYGSVENLQQGVRETGSMVDPGSGLNYARLQEFVKSTRSYERPKVLLNKYCERFHQEMPNERFSATLPVFRSNLKQVSDKAAYFLIMPLPDNCIDERIMAGSATITSTILDGIGSPPSHLIEGPLMQPAPYFSTVTHLNIYGRELYTNILADLLTKHFDLE